MARITHVKHARQRYATVPVLDAEGKRQRVPVLVKRTGQQKVTKRGTPVFMTLTKADKSKPLPPEKCGKCGTEIKVGDPYKWIAPKSGPYGGRRLVRCDRCPAWHVWEYSHSLSANLAEIEYNATRSSGWDGVEDAEAARDWAAEAVRSLAEEKRESAQNIEDGFGHEVSASMELNDIADQLESWADEIEAVEFPDLPEPEEEDCGECGGTGQRDDGTECNECEGTGEVTPEEPNDEQYDEWRSEAEDALMDVLGSTPV